MIPSESFATSGPVDGTVERDDAAVPPKACAPRRAGRLLFAIWALISLVWTGSVAGNLYYRASAQADMSRQVEHDLDTASCIGTKCGEPAAATPQERWADIAETYVQFGYVSLLEWAMVPPTILLVAGVGGLMWLRRRRAGQA